MLESAGKSQARGCARERGRKHLFIWPKQFALCHIMQPNSEAASRFLCVRNRRRCEHSLPSYVGGQGRKQAALSLADTQEPSHSFHVCSLSGRSWHPNGIMPGDGVLMGAMWPAVLQANREDVCDAAGSRRRKMRKEKDDFYLILMVMLC